MKDIEGLLIILACILITLGGNSNSFAARATQDSFRCPGSTRFVFIGDTASEVLAKCGEPSYVEKERGPSPFFYRDPVDMGDEEYRWYVRQGDIIGEVWKYNFGRGRLLYYLTFQSGELVRIETGGYGY
jgi:hypothetical protein